jgi:hypothetical protein
MDNAVLISSEVMPCMAAKVDNGDTAIMEFELHVVGEAAARGSRSGNNVAMSWQVFDSGDT